MHTKRIAGGVTTVLLLALRVSIQAQEDPLAGQQPRGLGVSPTSQTSLSRPHRRANRTSSERWFNCSFSMIRAR